MKHILFILTITTAMLHAQVQPFPATRTALVMGAWNYSDPTFPELKGIEQDVDRMAAKLGELGFKVTTIKNPTLSQAKKAVDAFGSDLKSRGGGGVFYFSGHGAEHEGKNYLIPIGTAISSRNDLDDEALVANRVLGRMEESDDQVNLVFLDCCRNEMSKAGGTEGLAPMKARGSLIGFATASGKVAFSTNDGSPYTAALIKHLSDPGLSLSDMHTVVAGEVQQTAKQLGTDQRPGQYVELSGLFQMVPGASTAPQTSTPVTVAPPATMTPRSLSQATGFSAGKYEGSVWHMIESDGETMDLYFMDAGVIEFHAGTVISRRGTWTHDGNEIVISAGSATLRGQVRDGLLSGKGQSTSVSGSWTWKAALK